MEPTVRGPIEVVVEIPRGSRMKYEYDHLRHRFVLDRVLFSSVHYPCDYGFIEGSLAEDGDPLDVLVVISEATFPGCVVRARPVGVLDQVSGWLGVEDAWRIIDGAMAAGAKPDPDGPKPGTWR